LCKEIIKKINQNESSKEATLDIRDLSFVQACQALLESNAKIQPKTFFSLIGKTHNLVVFRHFYLNQLKSKEYRDVNFFNAIITKGKESEEFFKIAKAAFSEANNGPFIHAETDNSFILAAGRTDHFDQVQEAFSEVRSKKIANAETFEYLMDIAKNTGHIEEVRDAFLEAKDRGYIEEY